MPRPNSGWVIQTRLWNGGWETPGLEGPDSPDLDLYPSRITAEVEIRDLVEESEEAVRLGHREEPEDPEDWRALSVLDLDWPDP